MTKTIADSITIKVGYGVMTIPRDVEKIKKQRQFTTDKDNKNTYAEKIGKSTQ